MNYERALGSIEELKKFVNTQLAIQDKRNRSYRLVEEQLQAAYTYLCLARNHINVASKRVRPKGGKRE